MLPFIPVDPFFVNRTFELGEFDAVLAGLERGQRRHLALLGLRRIGKTLLLDEVRRLHPEAAIVYLALDEVVSTPEDFVRALTAETLQAALAIRREGVGAENADLRALGQALHPDLIPSIENLVHLLESGRSYGALLTAALRFPSQVSQMLDLPMLVMLDEFQDIVRLRAFPHTETLLGSVRAALDRRGKVAFAVSGSRVTVMRELLSDGESPLFTRFEQMELRPFTSDGTHDLATRVWEGGAVTYAADASARLHRLTGGWPFSIQAVAARAAQIVRAGDGHVGIDVVDLAFYRELIGRVTALGQHCRYLLDTALRGVTEEMRSTAEGVLRQVARWGLLTRASLERRLVRHHPHTRIHRAINALMATDLLVEEGGVLHLADPVFSFWLRLEPERRDVEAALHNVAAMRRLLSWYEAQHAQDRQEMGTLFERRIENVARQFRGQRVAGRLFGAEGTVALPFAERVSRLQLDDPRGAYGDRPDSYEIDLVIGGANSSDRWAIEAKHRAGAITRPMVQRFINATNAVARSDGQPFARLWMVAPRGIRPDALELARSHGLLTSGLRHLEQLERMLADAV